MKWLRGCVFLVAHCISTTLTSVTPTNLTRLMPPALERLVKNINFIAKSLIFKCSGESRQKIGILVCSFAITTIGKASIRPSVFFMGTLSQVLV